MSSGMDFVMLSNSLECWVCWKCKGEFLKSWVCLCCSDVCVNFFLKQFYILKGPGFVSPQTLHDYGDHETWSDLQHSLWVSSECLHLMYSHVLLELIFCCVQMQDGSSCACKSLYPSFLIYTVKMCCIFSRCVSTGWKPFFILQAAIQSTNDRVQYNDLQSLLCATLQVSVKHLMYMTSFWAEWKRKGLYHLGCWFRYWFSFECLHYFLKWCEVFHQWDLRSIIFSERCPQDDTRGCTKDIWPDHDSIAEHVPKHQWKIGQCTRGCFSRCVNTVWRWVLPCVM